MLATRTHVDQKVAEARAESAELRAARALAGTAAADTTSSTTSAETTATATVEVQPGAPRAPGDGAGAAGGGGAAEEEEYVAGMSPFYLADYEYPASVAEAGALDAGAGGLELLTKAAGAAPVSA